MTHVRTLILGGGMSGLSCAYHLKSDYQLWEKSDEPGGLSRSIKKDGFVYDHTGHLLHLRDPYTLELIPRLLGDNIVKNNRNAWIFSSSSSSSAESRPSPASSPSESLLFFTRGIR